MEDQAHWIRFGPYELNTTERTILRKGLRLRLQDKPFDLLALLIQNPGQLVDREDLRTKLWSTGTNVDFEQGVRVAMHKLRNALDDIAESPRYIETVTGHGYRFIAPVSQHESNTRMESRPSLIAVLPAVGLTAGIDMGYIADGFTEELTAQLSKTNERQLSVIARTTAMCYKGANKSVAAIGAEMGVDYVLESSVRRHHGIYRLTAQLIRVSDQSHVWSESVQGDRGNPIEAQVGLSDQIVRALTTYLFPAKLPSFLATMYQAEEAPRSFRHSGRFRRYRTRVISIPKVTSRLVHRWFDPTKRRFKAKVRLLR